MPHIQALISDSDYSVLPISIVGAHRFYAAITNFLSLIAYWCSAFVAMLLIEHLYFRKNNFANYDLDAWNVPGRLPPGFAAVGSGLLSFALVIPCVSQVWFTGPIAKTTGDLGFEIALLLNFITYPPLRWLEIRYTGHL
jgi:purine-cytosine permease-like protein